MVLNESSFMHTDSSSFGFKANTMKGVIRALQIERTVQRSCELWIIMTGFMKEVEFELALKDRV